MKNKFGIKRDYTLGMFPYELKHDDGHMIYFFEIKKTTSHSYILKKQEKFKNKDLRFITTDKNCEAYTSTMDAINPYQFDNSKACPLYYLKKSETGYKLFYKVDYTIDTDTSVKFKISKYVEFSLDDKNEFLPF